ncbi:MAG: oxygen-independent coproporphyrinogen III oxidase-like protein [Betaproteobacteria bacterium]|nr:oxygen-independent coproporphyrinogen III oxidase-like protein [Betaproteobacteria bacterium]
MRPPGRPEGECRSAQHEGTPVSATAAEASLGARAAAVPATVVPATPSQPRFAALPPLALYVHIPWCLKKCPYCDFNSHELTGDPEADAYVAALLADLEFALPSIWGRKVVSVFIGGGTPSVFPAAAIDALLAGIRARVPLLPDAEVTLEANPGTFERARFAGFRAAGVNRLSLGIQSFDAAQLAALGRVHDGDEARRAADAALAIFGNVNFDLMYALPRQTVAAARADLAAALAFGPPHLSFYRLTLEPNTLFHRRPPPLPDDDTAADIEDAVEESLAAAGYGHYETSAHARPGRECRHNLNYWQFGDYLGIGAGAHSKLSFPDRIRRELRHKQPRRYLAQVAAGAPLQESFAVSRDDVGFEFMLNALRLHAGVPAALFAERTGYPLASIARELAAATARGLLDPDPAMLRPTPLGRRFLNDLQTLFLRERTPADTAADGGGR